MERPLHPLRRPFPVLWSVLFEPLSEPEAVSVRRMPPECVARGTQDDEVIGVETEVGIEPLVEDMVDVQTLRGSADGALRGFLPRPSREFAPVLKP